MNEAEEVKKITQQQVNPFAAYEPMSEMFALPSKGRFYPEIDGKRLTHVKVYDLVTQDENILLSPTLLESGEMVGELLKRKVETPYPIEKFTTGDRLALLVYIRATMEQLYKVRFTDPETTIPFDYEIDLMSLQTKETSVLPNQEGLFDFILPKDQRTVTFKILTGEDEVIIKQKDKKEQKIKNTTDSFQKIFRLEQQIVSIEGINDIHEKMRYIRNMKIMDSRKLISYMDECMPTIDFNIEVSTPSGGRFHTGIPFNVMEFLFPDL